jgi:hypothetical protein
VLVESACGMHGCPATAAVTRSTTPLCVFWDGPEQPVYIMWHGSHFVGFTQHAKQCQQLQTFAINDANVLKTVQITKH